MHKTSIRHPSVYRKDCVCAAILVGLVTPVVSDHHINISHFHLEHNIVLTEGAAVCLAACSLPGDSLGAEDKHICAANTPQQTIMVKLGKC